MENKDTEPSIFNLETLNISTEMFIEIGKMSVAFSSLDMLIVDFLYEIGEEPTQSFNTRLTQLKRYAKNTCQKTKEVRDLFDDNMRWVENVQYARNMLSHGLWFTFTDGTVLFLKRSELREDVVIDDVKVELNHLSTIVKWTSDITIVMTNFFHNHLGYNPKISPSDIPLQYRPLFPPSILD